MSADYTDEDLDKADEFIVAFDPNEIGHRQKLAAFRAEARREAFAAAKILVRPWIDGGVTFEEWEAAFARLEGEQRPALHKMADQLREKAAAESEREACERIVEEWLVECAGRLDVPELKRRLQERAK